jgi:hypothetical protein
MPKKSSEKSPRESLITELIETAVGTVLIGVLSYLISLRFGLKDELKPIVGALFLLIGLLLMILFMRVVRWFSNESGRRYMSQRTGIIHTFPNLDACKDDMQADFKRAKDVRLLLQIGRKELGDSRASYFYSLAKEKNTPGSLIKILRAASDSPFLSEARAAFRKTDVKLWREDTRRLGNAIGLLKSTFKVEIEERLHHEPFLWRIFIFDDVAYVSAYLYHRDVDSKCVVYKLKKGDTSLYTVFEKYFDYLWQKYDPSDSREPSDRWAEWK